MTEAEWLVSTDTKAMLRFLGRRASARKLRLFACASTRLYLSERDAQSPAGLGISATVMEGVQRAERIADGEELRESQPAPLDRLTSLIPEAREAASVTMTDLLWGKWLSDATRADLFRDLFGNPFFLAAFSRCSECDGVGGLWECPQGQPLAWEGCPACHGTGKRAAPLDWVSLSVRQLAQAIYDDRAFADLPVLADALEEAGCTEEPILAHCREAGPHARGCWVVDHLLDKN
jgi:hypothetical protein